MNRLSSSEPNYSRPQNILSGWVAVAVVLLLLLLGVPNSDAQQNRNIGPDEGRQITLRQQLIAGLKAFSKSDKAFINKVVLQVEQGRLPRKLVDTTFLWARRKATQRSYSRHLRPIVYFQPGLTMRAKKIGVKL